MIDQLAFRLPRAAGVVRRRVSIMASMLALGSNLWDIAGACYGNVRSDAEFDAQHRPLGSGPVQGVDLAKAVPGVYFANFLGQPVVELTGSAQVESCPAVAKVPLGAGGWLLTTATDPSEWDTESALSLKNKVREHLGKRMFFDLDQPERSTIAPFYDFRDVRIGEPPSVLEPQSIAGEFFSTAGEARAFLDELLTYYEQMRERAGIPADLVLSPTSLRLVDDTVMAIRRAQAFQKRALVLEVAAFFGEVLRRTLGATWRFADDPLMPIMTLPSGEVEYPLVRAAKLLDGADRLADWYDFVARGGRRLLI